MMKRGALILMALLGQWAGSAQAQAPDGALEIEAIQPGVYLVRDYLSTQDFGRVDCNGLLYIVNGKALVIDTPHTEALSKKLIERIRQEYKARIIGVVIGHTHADSMGGLAAFIKAGIPSYSSRASQELARRQRLPVPKVGFKHSLDLQVGDRTVQCRYFGPGHTIDNSVTYLCQEKVLFGDCLVKAQGASKGYLGDADVKAWPMTIARVREAFPDVLKVVPGHGKIGGPELLEYTQKLFSK